MIYLYLAIVAMTGMVAGASLMYLFLVERSCNHQWHTIATGGLPDGHYWVDQCQECGELRARREVA